MFQRTAALNKRRIPEPTALFGQKALVFKIISLKIYDHTIDILDGFPRTVEQAEALSGIAKIDAVVDLAVADEVLVKRLSGRRVCLKCGATYHISLLDGKTTCAACGEELIQRDDDKAETVLNRLTVYHAKTAPLIDFYQKAGLLRSVNADDAPEAVTAAVLAALEASR